MLSTNTLPTLLRRLLIGALAALVLVGLVSGPAGARVAVEPYGSYQPQVSCDPHAKPGVVAFRRLMFRRFGGGDLGIARSCSTGGLSEHKEGRAWDWALNHRSRHDRAIAKAALTWLTEPVNGDQARRARRLGVMYMIWNARIWSAYRASEGWRRYTGSDGHTSHIHLSFTWNGATKRTSWWTGRIMPYDYGPCPRWIGEYARAWHAPRLTPCPPAIRRPVANARGYYRVQYGDTVGKVARYFHRTPAQIRLWNDFVGPVVLHVGQRVRVVRP